jgi:hypothetical protein
MFKPLKHSVKQDSMRIQEGIKQMSHQITLNCSWPKRASRVLKPIEMLEKSTLMTLREIKRNDVFLMQTGAYSS